MNTSILNFNIIRTPETKYSDAQIFLQEFTGNKFSREDAEALWSQVIDHKWHVSNNLHRDVGLRVAAVDFMENFYAPHLQTKRRAAETSFSNNFGRKVKRLTRSFFEAMGQSLNY
jgi:hypothetical protein